MRGAENGYAYTGDTGNVYRVTMLRREIRKGASMVRIEGILTGSPTIPTGASVTVPTRKLAAL